MGFEVGDGGGGGGEQRKTTPWGTRQLIGHVPGHVKCTD